MARIVYGVQGDAHGHAVRALSVARRFPEHEFLFVSYDAGARLIGREYPVFESPGLPTVVRNHRLDSTRTLLAALNSIRYRKVLTDRLLARMEEFKPDVALTDYEFFVPRACRQIGLPCLSFDHQHVITCFAHPVPLSQTPSYLATWLSIRCLFSAASDYMVTSFFRPRHRRTAKVRLVPPLLRESVSRTGVTVSDHVVAYRSHPPSELFAPFLGSIPRPVMVYGFDTERKEGNLHFKRRSEEGFLRDLASCSYVVCSGGHTLMSEALSLGKPVLSFPIAKLFEQYLNAFYLQRSGYGRHLTDYGPRGEAVASFENDLEKFRGNIGRGRFCGNDEIYSLIRSFIGNGKLPSAERSGPTAAAAAPK
ncbi:MAG: hypothetical protein LLG06_11195 [Desulfobacteraceae bacterium]|nr:hypothetical protein [Desulfobacteraceae bacterium]